MYYVSATRVRVTVEDGKVVIEKVPEASLKVLKKRKKWWFIATEVGYVLTLDMEDVFPSEEETEVVDNKKQSEMYG